MISHNRQHQNVILFFFVAHSMRQRCARGNARARCGLPSTFIRIPPSHCARTDPRPNGCVNLLYLIVFYTNYRSKRARFEWVCFGIRDRWYRPSDILNDVVTRLRKV
jgi:hypothetical protein